MHTCILPLPVEMVGFFNKIQQKPTDGKACRNGDHGGLIGSLAINANAVCPKSSIPTPIQQFPEQGLENDAAHHHNGVGKPKGGATDAARRYFFNARKNQDLATVANAAYKKQGKHYWQRNGRPENNGEKNSKQ